MSLLIATPAAVDRLQASGFLFRNEAEDENRHFAEYQRESRGFLQRIVVYRAKTAASEKGLEHAVLRTKCSPRNCLTTVYDVEHLFSSDAACVELLVDAADAHLQQFATAGAMSFFKDETTATPHYDVTKPYKLL